MSISDKPLLPISERALAIHEEIVYFLKVLANIPLETGIDAEFKETYFAVLEIYEEYQEMVITDSGEKACCYEGCAQCCFHWVEDVYSFEGEIIAQYLKKNHPDKIKDIVQSFSDDEKELLFIQEIMEKKILKNAANDPEFEEIDAMEILLSGFYQLKRPCALLDENKSCIIYAVRPLTCRVFLNFSEPVNCHPDFINSGEVHTYILDLEEEAIIILDKLHEKYKRFGENQGLRSMLLKLLS